MASCQVPADLLPSNDFPSLLTIGEAAIRLRCSVKSVRRYVKSGRLPAHRCGRGKLLFTPADLWALLHGTPTSSSTPSSPDPIADALGGLARDLTG